MGLQRTPAQRFGGINAIDAPYDLNPDQARDLINVRPSSVENLESIEGRGGALPVIGDAYAPGGFWGAVPVSGHQGLNGDELLLLDEARSVWRLFSLRTYNGGGIAQYYPSVGSDKGIWCGAPYADYIYLTTLGYLVTGSSSAADSPKYTSPTPGFNSWTGTNVPRDVRSMVLWRSRLVATQMNFKSAGVLESYLLYSEAGDPNNWGSGPNKLRIPDDTGSLDGKLVVHRNNLYLIKERSLWMIYDPNTLFNRKIADVGIGSFANLNTAVSCPYDGRLYWLDATTGFIWSTNGETDCVLENDRFPLTSDSHPDFHNVWLRTSLGYPDAKVQRSIISTARMAYDPQRQSIMVSFCNTDPAGAVADSVSYVVEILLRGKPGDHPIYLHKYQPSFTHMMTANLDDSNNASGLPGRPTLIHSSAHPSGGTARRSLFSTFGDPTGGDYLDTGSKAYQAAFWKSGWKPFAAEEPVERVRRINVNYRGQIALKYYAGDDPSFFASAALKTWQSPDLSYTSGTKHDRDFKDLRLPNYKARYHAFDVIADMSPAPTEKFRVSLVEFVLRGGKEKR